MPAGRLLCLRRGRGRVIGVGIRLVVRLVAYLHLVLGDLLGDLIGRRLNDLKFEEIVLIELIISNK